MLLERKGPFLKFLGRTLNEVIGCYWVCVFVCSLTSPKRLILMSWNFEGRYPFGVQMILGKKTSGLSNCSPENQKKTLAIIAHVIHCNTTENHYNFVAVQPLVWNWWISQYLKYGYFLLILLSLLKKELFWQYFHNVMRN